MSDPTTKTTPVVRDAIMLASVTDRTGGESMMTHTKRIARTLNSPAAMRVDFTVNNYVTSPGQDIYISGNVPELGNWDVTKAVKLNWVDSDTWSGPVFFSTSKGSAIQYKYIMRSGGTIHR